MKKEPLQTPSLLNWNQQHCTLFSKEMNTWQKNAKKIVVYNSQDKWNFFWRQMFFIQSKNISGATSHQKKTFCEKPFLKILFIVWEILILQFRTTKWSAPYISSKEDLLWKPFLEILLLFEKFWFYNFTRLNDLHHIEYMDN